MVGEFKNPYATNSASPPLLDKETANTVSGWGLLGSLLVMIPWPVLGVGACMSLSAFEGAKDIVFLFGGVTMIFLLPLAFVVSSEWIFAVIVATVWLFVLFLPLWFGSREKHSRSNRLATLASQSGFSLIQTGLGVLILIGRGI